MIGFIFMIDEFRPDNGASCFAPGSQGAPTSPAGELVQDDPVKAAGRPYRNVSGGRNRLECRFFASSSAARSR
jgi:hypothetical protein